MTVTANGTTYKMGDLGSQVLPVSAPEDTTTWKIGETPRVAWGFRYKCVRSPVQHPRCPTRRTVRTSAN